MLRYLYIPCGLGLMGLLAVAGYLRFGQETTTATGHMEVRGYDAPVMSSPKLPNDAQGELERPEPPGGLAPRPSPRELPHFFQPTSAEALLASIRADGEQPRLALSVSEQVLLGRLLAIDDLLARYADHYGNDYLFHILSLMAESVLDPLAQGPQEDDRGLGQVGYWAERAGRDWGTETNNVYYTPNLSANASVWEPETNLILSSILMRWVATHPAIDSPGKNYAVYTFGDAGVDSRGAISPIARIRVDRAESHRATIMNFLRLKAFDGDVADPVTSAILAIDRTKADGREAYTALRTYYLGLVASTSDPWVVTLFGQEALNLIDLSERVYGERGLDFYARLQVALQSRQQLVASDGSPPVQAQFRRLVAETERRLAG
jgi:hypothetical protein